MEIIHIISGKIELNERHKINRIVENIVKWQKNNHADVSIWCIDYQNHPVFFRRKTKFLNFPSSRTYFTLNQKIKTEIIQNENAVFHFHGAFILEYFLISKLLTKKKIKYVFSPHYTADEKPFSIINLLHLKVFEKVIIENAMTVQCNEASDYKMISEEFPDADRSLITLPLDNRITATQFKPLRKRDQLTFGYRGEISTSENELNTLLEGFLRYKTKLNGDANLWIIGTSKNIERLKKIFRSTRDYNSIFFKTINSEQQELNLIANLDILFSPTSASAYSSRVLEAAQLGIPSVTNIQSPLWNNISLYDAGLSIKKNKCTNIATAMKKIEEKFISNTLYKHGENALKMIHKEYNWSKVSTKILALYPLTDS